MRFILVKSDKALFIVDLDEEKRKGKWNKI